MQLKQTQLSNELKSLNKEKIRQLTDEEIYHYLKNEIGISIGPLVKTTRPLYEKLLCDSIDHLDNLDEFLNNFTKTGDEIKKTKSTTKRVNDSGHVSMNSLLNETTNGAKHNNHQLNGLNNFEQNNDEFNNSQQKEDHISKQANLSNKSNVSNKSTLSTKSNVSNRSNSSQQTSSTDSINKSTNLNLINESITSPIIPIIRITSDVDNNFDKGNQLNAIKETRCSTPIDRQMSLNVKRTANTASLDDNGHDAKRNSGTNYTQSSKSPQITSITPQYLGTKTSVSLNIHKASGLSRTDINPTPITVEPVANETSSYQPINRKLVFKPNFKSANSDQQQSNIQSENLSGYQRLNVQYEKPSYQRLNVQSEKPNYQRLNFQPEKSSNYQQPKYNFLESQTNHPQNIELKQRFTSSLQFSDKEDGEDGNEYEYKVNASRINQPIRQRLSSGLSRSKRMPFTRNEYLKRTNAPVYNTNHPPPSNYSWLNGILIVVLALFIFSIVLAFIYY